MFYALLLVSFLVVAVPALTAVLGITVTTWSALVEKGGLWEWWGVVPFFVVAALVGIWNTGNVSFNPLQGEPMLVAFITAGPPGFIAGARIGKVVSRIIRGENVSIG